MKDTYTKGLISFIVPCYNGAKYIKRFFEHLSSQTYNQIQLILINDGSTDNTEEVISNHLNILTSKDIHFTYLKQENGGMGKAINRALKHIEGEFFTWYGIDDYPLPNYCETAVAFLNENKDYALVRIDGYFVDENDNSLILGKVADCNNDKNNPYIFWNAVEEKNFQFGYSVLRTAVFEDENNGLDIYESYHGQNWQLLLPILYRNKCKFIDTPLYNVIVHQDSVSRAALHNYEKRILQLMEYQKILVTTLSDMKYISGEDKEKAMHIVESRYAHRIYVYSISNFDFSIAKSYRKILLELHEYTKSERVLYRNRFRHLEYWLHWKHKILG